MLSYEATVRALYKIPTFGKKSSLERMAQIMDYLGLKRKNLPVIHVAGTNGKGSVCKMLATLYTQAGFRVGLFTSPHLVKVNERIQINNQPVPDEQIVTSYDFINNSMLGMGTKDYPTFFEMMFLMALYLFEHASLDVLVIETGIGGLLDCTNVLDAPMLSVITQIDYDHMALLGHTLEAIANQKAGIIKPHVPVVYQQQQAVVNQIIRKQAERLGCHCYNIQEDTYKIHKISPKGIDFSYYSKYYKYEGLSISSVAVYQVKNVCTALLACDVLQPLLPITQDVIQKACESFYWPGRMEYFPNERIILDGAHNIGGIEAFLASLKVLKANDEQVRFRVMFGINQTKAYEAMIQQLMAFDCIEDILVVFVDGYNEATWLRLKASYPNLNLALDVSKAFLNLKSQLSENEFLCCIGSLYLIGDIHAIMGGKND